MMPTTNIASADTGHTGRPSAARCGCGMRHDPSTATSTASTNCIVLRSTAHMVMGTAECAGSIRAYAKLQGITASGVLDGMSLRAEARIHTNALT